MGQVGSRLHRVRHGRGARRARPTPGSRGPTSSTSPAPTPSATATRASSPARRSRRSSAGPACACRRATPRARRARRRCTTRARRSSPASATSRSSIGADTTPKGFFAPVGGERKTDPDWLRFHLLGATNPTYFALYARRRMDVYGATDRRLRAGEGEELAATGSRTRTRASARRTRSTTCSTSPIVADPLRLLDICATSDGARGDDRVEHGLRRSATSASTDARAARQGGVHRHAALPADACSSCPTSPPTPARSCPPPDRGFTDSIARRGVRGGGHRPRRPRAWPRSTTCPPRSSSTGTRTSGCAARARPRRCCAPARPTIGGRIPVNPSGGLACFGEAIPAQAIAQVCEVTWQLRGQADGRQVEGATRRHHRQPGTVRSRVVRDRQHVARDDQTYEQEDGHHGRGLHRRRGPHPGRAARRRAAPGPPRRPRRARRSRR